MSSPCYAVVDGSSVILCDAFDDSELASLTPEAAQQLAIDLSVKAEMALKRQIATRNGDMLVEVEPSNCADLESCSPAARRGTVGCNSKVSEGQ